MRPGLPGELDPEPGAAGFAAVYSDLPAVRLDGKLAEGQAKTGGSGLAGPA
jgi:hypothetical protein